MPKTILLVEDDKSLRAGLSELFEREGFSVVGAKSARAARERIRGAIDLIVLDVSLPDGDGVELCRQWRAEGVAQPILFLTARDEELDIVRGLDSGGNDYVTKPFRMQELLSRIRALLRREPVPAGNHGDLTIDSASMRVKRNGEIIPLTLTEYKVLIMLAHRKGVVTRDMILGALWDDGAKYIDDNTLSVHISRLREKIGDAHIRTVRGVGYQWMD